MTFFYLGNAVAILIETDRTKTQIQTITVTCEPAEVTNEKNAIESTTVAYLLVIEILTPELTEDERGNLIHQLSYHMENSSVKSGDIVFKSRVYNRILMLSAETK